jgi:hypothetical protein
MRAALVLLALVVGGVVLAQALPGQSNGRVSRRAVSIGGGGSGFDGGLLVASQVSTPLIESVNSNTTTYLLGTQTGNTGFPDIIIGSANARSTSNAKVLSVQAGGVEYAYWDGTQQLVNNGNLVLGANILYGDYWFAVGVAGLFSQSNRGAGDPGADWEIHGNRNPAGTDGTAVALGVVENGLPVARITVDGTVFGGSQYSASSFEVSSGRGSGAVALRAASEQYLVLQGRLGDNVSAVMVDGGKPPYDGGSWVGQFSDGGTYYYYGGLHGDIGLVPSANRQGGLIVQVQNTPLVGGASSWFIDPWAGFGIISGLQRADFPPLVTNIATSLGQYFFGTFESTWRYAVDTHNWYYHDGTDYAQVVTSRNSLNLIAPSTMSAYYDGQTIGTGTVVMETRMGLVVTGVSLAFTPTKAGADGAHTFTVEAFNRSSGTQLCVTGNIACNVAAGVVTRVACSTATVLAADDIDLRVNDVNCITVSLGNISWVYR